MAVPFSMARARSIAWRFGVSPRPMEARMAHFDALTAEFGVRPTWAVTAGVLQRNPAAIHRFLERGVELAVHVPHDDLSLRSPGGRRAGIARAAQAFRDAEVPFSGFRAPFLRANNSTDQAVAELGFVYSSSSAVSVDVAKSPVRPAERGGIVHLPIALPDDAELVERLRLPPAEQAAAWRAVLDATWRRGELFTLRLNPERIYECGEALRAVLADARGRRPAVWIATLDRIARWWRRRAATRLGVHELEPGRFRVVLDGDPMATLLVRNLAEGDCEPWFGADRMARSRDFEVRCGRIPMVGVSTRSPAAVLAFLAEEGFPAERSDDAPRYGAWIDVAGGVVDEAAVLAAIEAADGPMVRLGRWPAGARSALSVTGDIGCMTLQDFALRMWETRR